MKKSNRELKFLAKNALRGNYTVPIFANILISALSLVFDFGAISHHLSTVLRT